MKLSLFRILSTVVILAFSLTLCTPCHADEAAHYDFHALFQRVENMDESEKETLSEELSSTFHKYPFDFIKALTLENSDLHDSVRKMLAEYNTFEDGNADYLQFLLSLYPLRAEKLDENESNTFLTLLLAFDPDPRNAREDFTATLFTALRYADGIGADQCSTILFRIFLQDSKGLVENLSHEDQDFQKLAVMCLNYGSWGRELDFLDKINSLAADDNLTDAERNIVDALLEAVTPEEENTVPETEPETTPSPEYDTTAPTETELAHKQPDSKPTVGNTVILVIAAVSILAFIAITCALNRRSR